VTNPDDRRITLAAVAGAHGVRGEVRLKLFGEGPDSLKRFATFDAAGRTLTLAALRDDGKGGAIARFAEIADRTAAEALRGTVLSVPRAALPPLATVWGRAAALCVVFLLLPVLVLLP